MLFLQQTVLSKLKTNFRTCSTVVKKIVKKKPEKSEKDAVSKLRNEYPITFHCHDCVQFQATQFVDYRVTRVQGGDGGNGCMSFLRIFGNEWAGPDGGNGGNGGHVIFKGNLIIIFALY
jgi:hypothetical protein